MRSSIQLLAVIAAFGSCDVVRAQEWPRYHIGVARGEVHLRQDSSSAGVPEHVWPPMSLGSTSGRKVVAGFRPVRVVGGEIQYVEFDEDSASRRLPGGQVAPNIYVKYGAKATVLSAVLFAPEPSPWFDVYGKVGVAKFKESFTGHYYDPVSVGCQFLSCSNYIDVDEADTRPYVGIGARFKIHRAVAIRFEYETIKRDVRDDTTMVSLGVAWEH